MSELTTQLQEMLKQPQLANLATVTEDGKPWTRYVMIVGDDMLNVRVVTSLKSRKIGQLKENPEVHVATGVASLQTAQSYVQVQGKAEIKTDEASRKLMWNENLKAYFSGPDDPNMAVIEIKPYRIELWGMTKMVPQVWER